MLNFSIRATLFLVAYLVVVVALVGVLSLDAEMREHAIFTGIPGYLSIIAVTTGVLLVCLTSDWKYAWQFLAMGWIFVCLKVILGIFDSFFIASSAPLARLNEIRQYGFNDSAITAIAFPLIITLPIVYPLVYNRSQDFAPPPLATSMPLCLAMLDTLLIWLMASFTCGTWGLESVG